MLISNHVISGAIIGELAPSIPVAAAAGFASHFLLDAVKHWGAVDDEKKYLKVAVVDGLAGLALLTAITATAEKDQRVKVLTGMLAACAPDVDKPAKQFFNVRGVPEGFQRFHQKIQKESSKRMPQEVLVASTLLAGLWGVRQSKRDRKNNIKYAL